MLAKIASPYAISASGVLGAVAAAGISSSLVAKLTNGLSVSDTAARVTANLTGLQALATAGKLASISLTDAGSPTLSLTAAQIAADPLVLAAISSPYAVSASGVAAAFNGDTIRNFSVAGSVLDITDLNSNTLTATFAENDAGAAGVLTLNDGVHALSVTLFGQFMAAGHSGTAASVGIVVTSDGVSGSKLTYNAALAPPR